MKTKSQAKAQKIQSKKFQKAKQVEKEASKVLPTTKKRSKIQVQQPQPPKPTFAVAVVGQSKQVTINSKYTLQNTHSLFTSIDNLVQLLNKKEQRKDNKLLAISDYTYFPTFEFQLQGVAPDNDKCCICQFQFTKRNYQDQLNKQDDEDIVQIKCGHILHIGCYRGLIGNKNWFRCPVCFTIVGVMIGDQPSGIMKTTVNKAVQCDGYPPGTIIINYSMNSGQRNGVHFSGTQRTAYLPDTPEGNEVLKLLKTAFDRKLIFTIGTSVTTGMENCVVWNGIHHKTHTSGGSSHFGYPDPTYFDRVKLELAAKGVY